MRMTSPYVLRELTKEEVEVWLEKARCRELNIFDDKNEIITLLCNQLLEEWDKND